MNSEITVALLSAAGTLLGSLGGILASNRLTNYRIAQLEKRVDKHNNLVERMATAEDCKAILSLLRLSDKYYFYLQSSQRNLLTHHPP